jgi:beta-lactamase class D
MSKSLFALLLASLLFGACTTNNVTVDDSLQKYFDSANVKGSFGFFDNGQGKFTIFDLPRFRDSAYLPAATFDIVQSLIALQTGTVKDDSSLRQAFRVSGDSAVTDFHELALRLGKDTLKKWIDSLHYGNRDMSGPPDSFWINDHLKITSDEQLGLIKRLYFGQLPFFNRPQKLVVNMMPAENNSNYKLVYKSGQGKAENGPTIGWITGWVEENKHPYFFVLNMETPDSAKDLTTTGLHIVKSILRSMGFFEGKK